MFIWRSLIAISNTYLQTNSQKKEKKRVWKIYRWILTFANGLLKMVDDFSRLFDIILSAIHIDWSRAVGFDIQIRSVSFDYMCINHCALIENSLVSHFEMWTCIIQNNKIKKWKTQRFEAFFIWFFTRTFFYSHLTCVWTKKK